jgi:hypothetical protein
MKGKIALGIAAILAAAAPASAARTFTFNYSGSITSGIGSGTAVVTNGTFTTTDAATNVGGRDALTVTGVTGARNGVSIAGLAPDFPVQFGGADNYLFLSGLPFSDFGVSFSLADGSFANFFNDGGEVGEYAATNLTGDQNRTNGLGVFTFSEVTGGVPEPATWALMIGGFGLVGAATRRRSAKIAAAA